MNWDIDTEDGLRNAQHWLRSMLTYLADNAVCSRPTIVTGSNEPWGVPRSSSMYQIDKKQKVATVVIGDGDRATDRVFNSIGWTVKYAGRPARQSPDDSNGQ